MRIDIPWINTVVRDRINNGADPSTFDHLVDGLTPGRGRDQLSAPEALLRQLRDARETGERDRAGLELGDRASGRQSGHETSPRHDERRDLPEFRRETLVDWFRDREATGPSDPDRWAVVYPNVYTNHVQVERGKAAVRALEALGVAVEVPEVSGSGRAPLSQGMIATAERKTESVVDAHELYVAADYDVVEPSDLAMFRDDYEKLLDPNRYEPLSANSYEVMEYATAWSRTAPRSTGCGRPQVTADWPTTAIASSGRLVSRRTRKRSSSGPATTSRLRTVSAARWPGASATRASTTS